MTLQQSNDVRLLLTVVVCTRNRGSLLAELLSSLAQQNADKRLYEILIVDNGSTDQTAGVVAAKKAAVGDNLRYIFEPQIGLSFARNRGWKEAKADYVAYLDDECRLPPQWLEVAIEIISSVHPDAFGGPIYPIYSSKKPRWFKDSYESADEGIVAGTLPENQYLSGGNMILRRDLLQSEGGFETHLGMSGEKIGYGEETLFLKRLRDTRPVCVYYDQRLQVFHLIRPEKMRLSYVARSRFAFGRSMERIWGGSVPGSQIEVYKKLFWILRQFLKESVSGILIRDRKRYPHFQNYLFEKSFHRLVNLGKFVEVLAKKRQGQL